MHFELWTGPDPARTQCSMVQRFHPRKKQQGAAFLPLAFQTQNPVGPINSKLRFFHYQTCCVCVLSKTQTQPIKQTLPFLLLNFFPKKQRINFPNLKLL